MVLIGPPATISQFLYQFHGLVMIRRPSWNSSLDALGLASAAPKCRFENTLGMDGGSTQLETARVLYSLTFKSPLPAKRPSLPS